jgi:hypothetical protein
MTPRPQQGAGPTGKAHGARRSDIGWRPVSRRR